jgi:hypothetical protein
MAATKINANWSGVKWGPSGTETTITKVTNVSIKVGRSMTYFKGDVDVYDTLAVNLANKPSMTVTSADEYTLMTLANGTAYSLTAIHKDSKGAASGDVKFVMLGVIEDVSAGGAHGSFGSASATFSGVSTDGTTSPLAITLV